MTRSKLHEDLTHALGEQLATDLMDAIPKESTATKADIDALGDRIDRSAADLRVETGILATGLRGEMADFRREVRADMAEFRKETRAEMSEFRQEIRAELAGFRSELDHLRTDMQRGFRSQTRAFVMTSITSSVMVAGLVMAAVQLA